jgi:hypothetical protein
MNLKAFSDLVKAYYDAPGESGKRFERAILEVVGTSKGHGEEIASLCEMECFTPLVPKSV